MTKNYISNKDETVRMFKSDFLESLSKVHFTVPLFIFLPVIFIFLYMANFKLEIPAIYQFGFGLFGILVWTLTEYLLHRFIFHFEPGNKIGQKLHFIFHGVHHDYPNDTKRLVMPPSVSVPLAALFYFLFSLLLNENFVPSFFVGFLVGYLIYDMTHYAVHHLTLHDKLFLILKKHHMKHHYKDKSKGFGVSQQIWDYIWCTNFSSEDVNNVNDVLRE